MKNAYLSRASCFNHTFSSRIDAMVACNHYGVTLYINGDVDYEDGRGYVPVRGKVDYINGNYASVRGESYHVLNWL